MECGVRFQPARLFCLFFPEASHRAATVNPRIGLANRNHSIFLKDGPRFRQIGKMQTIGKKKKFYTSVGRSAWEKTMPSVLNTILSHTDLPPDKQHKCVPRRLSPLRSTTWCHI